MGKYTRTEVGSICKSKDAEKPDYIKVNTDITLKKGDILNLESKKSKLEGIDTAVQNGKLSQDKADEIIEKINAMPEWVRFSIVRVVKNEE